MSVTQAEIAAALSSLVTETELLLGGSFSVFFAESLMAVRMRGCAEASPHGHVCTAGKYTT